MLKYMHLLVFSKILNTFYELLRLMLNLRPLLVQDQKEQGNHRVPKGILLPQVPERGGARQVVVRDFGLLVSSTNSVTNMGDLSYTENQAEVAVKELESR